MKKPKQFENFIEDLKSNYHPVNRYNELLSQLRNEALEKINEYKKTKETLMSYAKERDEVLKYIDYLDNLEK